MNKDGDDCVHGYVPAAFHFVVLALHYKDSVSVTKFRN